MSNPGTHPAEIHEISLRTAQQRAMLASGALVVTVLVRVFNIPVRLWQSGLIRTVQAGGAPPAGALELSDTLVSVGAIAQLVLFVVTAVLFLRWLHRAVALTRALGGETRGLTPRDAVMGFVIPFVNISRPYVIVRDLHDTLEPDAVPDPPPQVRADESLGYRQVAMVAPPPPASLPHASIGAWWAFFWIGNLVANIASRQDTSSLSGIATANLVNDIADGIEIVSASLAVLMVRGLTARLVERYRRVRYNSPDALTAAGIELE